VNLYQYLAGTRHRLSDVHHLENVKESTGIRPSR
jgi:hypothetical protein